jgi:hypothetical protein
MGPLPSRPGKLVGAALLSLVLAGPTPAPLRAQTSPPAADDFRANLAASGLPPDVKGSVEKELSGPGGGAFSANAAADEVPEILALLVPAAGAASASDAASRLEAWKARAPDFQHDWKGDAAAEKTYQMLIASIAEEIAARPSARTAGGLALGNLGDFPARLSAVMISGAGTLPDARALNELYQGAPGARTKANGAPAVLGTPGNVRPLAVHETASKKTDPAAGAPPPSLAPLPRAAPAGSTNLNVAAFAALAELHKTLPLFEMRRLGDKTAQIARKIAAPPPPAASAFQGLDLKSNIVSLLAFVMPQIKKGSGELPLKSVTTAMQLSDWVPKNVIADISARGDFSFAGGLGSNRGAKLQEKIPLEVGSLSLTMAAAVTGKIPLSKDATGFQIADVKGVGISLPLISLPLRVDALSVSPNEVDVTTSCWKFHYTLKMDLTPKPVDPGKPAGKRSGRQSPFLIKS